MSYRSLLVIPLVIPLVCKAEEYALKKPFKSPNGLYGYKDGEGKFRILPKYDDAKPFFKGYAAVSRDDKWGYVDTKGKEVVPLKYDEIEPFSEGLARVRIGYYEAKYGLVDTTGKEVVPVKYDVVHHFYGGLAQVYLKGKYGFVDKEGNEYWDMTADEAREQMKYNEWKNR